MIFDFTWRGELKIKLVPGINTIPDSSRNGVNCTEQIDDNCRCYTQIHLPVHSVFEGKHHGDALIQAKAQEKEFSCTVSRRIEHRARSKDAFKGLNGDLTRVQALELVELLKNLT